MQHVTVDYLDARGEIGHGDVLLFRPRGFFWRMVAQAGRSEYCHGAVAGWWNHRLMCVEMTDGGGRAQLLSNIVRQWPGIIDVYGCPDLIACQRLDIVNHMLDATGLQYGSLGLLLVSLRHLPVIRWIVNTPTNDEEELPLLPFCTHLISQAYRKAGVDLVPNLPDRLTEPADVSRSAVLRYRFTLI